MAKKHTVSETNETISAVITALGEGAVGIIRISGTEAAAIGDKLFRSASGKKLTEHTPHLLVYGHVVDEENSKKKKTRFLLFICRDHIPILQKM